MDRGLVDISLQLATRDRLYEQLEQLRFNPRRRFELAREMGREVRKFSARRARKQEHLEGGAMAPRSAKRSRYRRSKDGNWRKKRRMFESLGKAGNMSTYRQDDHVVVSWKKKGKTAGWANVANAHFRGMDIAIDRGAAQLAAQVAEALGFPKQRHNRKDGEPATKRMADALLRHGYRQPVRGRDGKVRLRRISSMRIRKIMKQKQAAWLLRLLVHGSSTASKKTRWTVHIPARPFLGVNAGESEALLGMLATKVMAELDRR